MELNIQPILPEIFICSMACFILVLDLYVKPEQRRFAYPLTLAPLQ